MHFALMDVLALLFRWLHIVAAMALLGGPMFVRFALLPTIGELPDDRRQALLDGTRRRWSMVVRAAILFLLISGIYNYVAFLSAAKSWSTSWQEGTMWFYQFLFGIKFMLALCIFFLAEALTGRSAVFAQFREKMKLWATVLLLAGLLLVAISSQMRMLHIGPTPALATSSASV